MEEHLDLKEIDPIFSSSFEMMIKEAFRADKHFFLAKMKTRNSTKFTESHSHFFNAYGVLKLIFKKKGEEVVGRFHYQHPVSAKNPMTNNVSFEFLISLANHRRS